MNSDDSPTMEFLGNGKAEAESYLPDVAGYFDFPMSWTGLDLRKNSTSPKWARVIRTVLAVFICIVFFLAVIAIGTDEAQPFTVNWADRNLYSVMCVYAFASAICLFSWTKNNFLEVFQTELWKVKLLRRQPAEEEMDNYKKQRIGCTVYCVILVSSWILASFKDVFYVPQKESSNETEFHIAKENLFGTQPIVYFWMGVASCIATTIYWLPHAYLRREFEYFNKELKTASESHYIKNSDIFIEYCNRHRSLMLLLSLMNSHLGKMAMINSFTAGTAMCLSIYITMGFMKHLTIPYAILLSILNLIVAHSLTVIVGEPGKIQKQVYHTKKILLEDEDLHSAEDQKVLSCYRLFVDRCDNSSKMFLLSAVPVGRKTAHWVLFLVPNIATLLAFCGKLAGVIHS